MRLKYRNRIKRKVRLKKLKEELAWAYFMTKSQIKYELHYKFSLNTIISDINDSLFREQDYILSMNDHDVYKQLSDYLHINHLKPIKEFNYLTGEIVRKYNKYEDVEIEFESTENNLIIKLKLI